MYDEQNFYMKKFPIFDDFAMDALAMDESSFSLTVFFPCTSRYQLSLGRVICSSGEHVHSCCVLGVPLVELLPSRIMSFHNPDGSSVFIFDVVFSQFSVMSS